MCDGIPRPVSLLLRVQPLGGVLLLLRLLHLLLHLLCSELRDGGRDSAASCQAATLAGPML